MEVQKRIIERAATDEEMKKLDQPERKKKEVTVG